MNLSKSICPSTCNRSQRGVALVVTLILLSVITFLAVAFLFLARREKGASSQGVAQLTAKRMNETGTERAIAETVSHITATRNPFNYELRVSTNYVNTLGFASGVGSLTNVNFFYPNGNPVWQNPNDFETLVGNLYYSPRPPVFITTNKGFPADFRYYWDLNRNGLYDTNGLWAVIGFNPGNPPFYYDTNGNQVANYDPANSLKYFFKGDPEFVGILQHPDRPHSSSNLFVGRFAWALVPSGKTMDVNYIHNQSRQANQAVVSAPEGFSRNMGVGTWELNLGAFLSDLNTNYWGDYVYQIANPNQPAGGYAMLDAWRMLQYRYDAANGIGTRAISQVLPAGAGGLRTDLIDDFGSGFPLFTNVAPPAFSPDNGPDRTVGPWHWPGDDNPNHLFTTQDFFDANKIRNLQPLIGGDRGFGYRLQSSGLGISSYDRYTYYRMLEQLGTDSAPEPTGKMHLNYVNVDAAGKTVVDAQTNFVPWQALQFFTNALDRILAATYDNADTNVVLFNVHAPLSFTNIPVWVSNRFVYTAGLHRCLQMAANLYDASVPHEDRGLTNYPSVFRPYFRQVGNDIFIDGFTEVTSVDVNAGLKDPQLNVMVDLNNLPGALPANANIYGVPWVIGARKGMPNFNEFAMQSISQISRKLQIRKPAADRAPNATNQLFSVGVSNAFAFEGWNSYGSAFSRKVRIHVANTIAMSLRFTNDLVLDRSRAGALPTWFATVEAKTNLAASAWRGVGNDPAVPSRYSFVVPLNTNIIYLPESYYRVGSGAPSFRTNLQDNSGLTLFRGFEQSGLLHQPEFNFAVSNRIRFLVMDEDTGRVLDYVQLNDLNGVRSLNSELGVFNHGPIDGTGAGVADGLQFWKTNRQAAKLNSPPGGVLNQILASLGAITVGNWNSVGQWNGGLGSKDSEIQAFKRFMLSPYTGNSESEMQVPFTPIRKKSQYITWQANDPLVHFTTGDLVTSGAGTGLVDEQPNGSIYPLPNIGKLNTRFEPWGGNPGSSAGDSQQSGVTANDPAAKDPGVFSSDYWDFPTNKYPALGTLGRIHRGTPWQTVYMKSAEVNLGVWTNWSGNPNLLDAIHTQPKMDRVLFDLFTTAVDQNATRGQVNVNQTNLATWSALFGGVIGLTNTTPDADLTSVQPFLRYEPLVIEPASVSGGDNSTLAKIYRGINATRASAPYNGYFRHTGDILATPELTLASPLLNTNSSPQLSRGISDSAYERLPQMVMSLLRGNDQPRFTIYSIGQTLQPAARSRVMAAGPFFNMCTNYQITAEVVTRTVVRIDGAPTTPRAVIESYNILGPE